MGGIVAIDAAPEVGLDYSYLPHSKTRRWRHDRAATNHQYSPDSLSVYVCVACVCVSLGV